MVEISLWELIYYSLGLSKGYEVQVIFRKVAIMGTLNMCNSIAMISVSYSVKYKASSVRIKPLIILSCKRTLIRYESSSQAVGN